MNCPDKNRRYFRIAGITVCLQSDLDFDKVVFREELLRFSVAGPGNDTVTLRHRFGLPDVEGMDWGRTVYRRIPWAISRNGGFWYYRGIKSEAPEAELQWLGIFNENHTSAVIYSEKRLERVVSTGGGWPSLSLFPTDQVWLAPLLADRNAVLLHSAGAILNGQGLLFLGHSEAGKSTTAGMLKGRAQILCDDRNVARRWDGGWRVHGTWSRGDVADVSGSSAPLGAVLWLHQKNCNEIMELKDKKVIWKYMLGVLVKSVTTAAWWEKEIDILGRLIGEVPCYAMHFDRSGGIVRELENLVKTLPPPSPFRPGGGCA